jgi:hypothetical protein
MDGGWGRGWIEYRNTLWSSGNLGSGYAIRRIYVDAL